jgi:hypothetical protein
MLNETRNRLMTSETIITEEERKARNAEYCLKYRQQGKEIQQQQQPTPQTIITEAERRGKKNISVNTGSKIKKDNRATVGKCNRRRN